MPPAETLAPIRVLVSGSSRARLEAARSFVRALPPATEALLLGASREAVDDWVRELTLDRGATFGLRRLSLMQLAALLAMDDLAERGRAPASPLSMDAVAARAAFDARAAGRLPELADLVDLPGFPRALARTLAELRTAAVAAPAVAERARAELGALLEGYAAELERAALADRALLLEAATRALALPRHAGLRAAPLLLLDVPVADRAARAWVAALAAGERPVLATVPSGDEDTLAAWRAIGGAALETADAPLAVGRTDGESLSRLRRHLFSDEEPPRGELDAQVEFFSAPGEARECVELVRRILDLAGEGVAFDRIAVLVRSPESYAPHLESAFRRAAVPAYLAPGTRRPDPAGRAFLALLACRGEGLSARRFAEYLSFAQVPPLEADGAPPRGRELWVPPEEESLGPAAEPQLAFSFMASGPGEADPAAAPPGGEPEDADEVPLLAGALRAPWKWEEYLVEAAVIGGRERWERRLRGLEAELRLQRDLTLAEEPGSPRAATLDRDLVQLGHLQRFALPLIAALDALPARARWSAWLEALARLAPMALARPERVLAVLAEMQPMGAVGPAGLEEVRAVLAPRLATLEEEPPAQRFGRVFVGTPQQARGRSFEVVFVPGLAERLFPQRPREDPLLLDGARRALSGDLDTQEDRGARERLLLRLAVGAAERRLVLSYPRMEVVEARPRVPSFYGLDVMRAVRGEIPAHEELERGAAARGAARLAWPAPDDPARAIDDVEHDLAVLGPLLRDAASRPGRARYLFDLNPHLARSLRSRWVRWGRRWRPEDGIVRAAGPVAEVLAAHRPRVRAYSATGLQRFATCPYQFLLAAIHRLEPRREAVFLIRLDPLTRGSLVHEVQARTLAALKARRALPVRPEALAEATAVLDREVAAVAARWRDDLAPAIPRIWDDEVRGLQADLRIWLRRLSAEAERWTPIEFELAFGLPATPDRPVALRAPVALEGGYLLHGAVDLVEEKADGSALRVTDHKTGANRVLPKAVVGGGEMLQPVLYSLAVEGALGRPVEQARLSFCTSRGGFTEHVVAIDGVARLGASRVLETVDDAVARGALPPAPRREACRWCDFRIVCGPREERRAAQKDPRLTERLDDLRGLR